LAAEYKVTMDNGRWLATSLRAALARPYVHILFGARQTGKSTLLRNLLPEPAIWIDLADPAQRSRHLARPERLIEACAALPSGKQPPVIVIDEVQTVPALFDAVQHLFDRDKRRFRFVLSGSSARKLRTTGANLLPGRSFLHRLHPLTLAERPATLPRGGAPCTEPLLPRPGDAVEHPFPSASLLDRLAFGELPGIATASVQDRAQLLHAYAYVYLEEELRREALIKDWAVFSRFLRLAALESGGITNFAAIARQAGTSLPTVKSHYQLLEDMFIGVRVEAFAGSKRKQVLSTPRFMFFDLGVRHAAAELTPSHDTVLANPGPVFEQWVGIELWKRLQYSGRGRLNYLRTKSGAEIDFIVDLGTRLIPIEVKWTESPDLADARHLLGFLDEQGSRAPHGYIVCRCQRPLRLHDHITALPWWWI
jgi:predicted AAA+ superfamily ATPase